MVRFTHNDFDVSVIGNRDRNKGLHTRHDETREFLLITGIAKPEDLRGDERMAPGALTISKLSRVFHDEKVTGFEMRMRYPIIARTDGVEVTYETKEVEGDDFSRKVKVKVLTPSVCGTREMTAMTGTVYLHKKGEVDIPVTFWNDQRNTLLGDVSEKKTLDTLLLDGEHRLVNQEFPDEFPDDFYFDEELLRRYCQSAGVPLNDYHRKFGDTMSPMIAAYLMVDPMVHYADCVAEETESRARQCLKVDDDVPLNKIQLYSKSSMCSSDKTEVSLGNYVDVYVRRGGIVCKPKNGKALCDCLLYLLMVNREDGRPIAAGTFNAAEQYFLKE